MPQYTVSYTLVVDDEDPRSAAVQVLLLLADARDWVADVHCTETDEDTEVKLDKTDLE